MRSPYFIYVSATGLAYLSHSPEASRIVRLLGEQLSGEGCLNENAP
jgi:hypothetical protein